MSDYPQPPPPYGYAPDHPRATTALVLGILSLVVCQVLGPVAWVIGGNAVKEIDASQGRVGGRGSAKAGQVCGIVATILLVLGVLLLVLLVAVGTMASVDYS